MQLRDGEMKSVYHEQRGIRYCY